MDHKTDLQSLKDQVKKFCDDRDWDKHHDAKELAIAISTEANELLTHFRFLKEAEIEDMFNDPIKREAITDEMADVLFPLLRLAQVYDIDLATEFQRKFKKNELNYPLEKSKGSKKHHSEL